MSFKSKFKNVNFGDGFTGSINASDFGLPFILNIVYPQFYRIWYLMDKLELL